MQIEGKRVHAGEFFFLFLRVSGFLGTGFLMIRETAVSADGDGDGLNREQLRNNSHAFQTAPQQIRVWVIRRGARFQREFKHAL